MVIVFLISSFFIVEIAFGAFTYERMPSGTEITSPVSVSLSFENSLYEAFDLFPGDYWKIMLEDRENQSYGGCHASTTLSDLAEFNLPVGTEATIVDIEVFGTLEGCETNAESDFLGYHLFEGSLEYQTIFTIVSGGPTALFTIPTSYATGTLAYVTGIFGDTGSLKWILLAGGIYLAFYAIERFIELLPVSSIKK